jgi:hypothetical protein
LEPSGNLWKTKAFSLGLRSIPTFWRQKRPDWRELGIGWSDFEPSTLKAKVALQQYMSWSNLWSTAKMFDCLLKVPVIQTFWRLKNRLA